MSVDAYAKALERIKELEAERAKLRAALKLGHRACSIYSKESNSCRHSAVAALNFWPRLEVFLTAADEALRGEES
jgi:hypothetical protein